MMRCLTLAICFAIALESVSFGYDLPVPRTTNLNGLSGTSTSQFGTIVGGVLLAAGLFFTGLWWSRKRNAARANSEHTQS